MVDSFSCSLRHYLVGFCLSSKRQTGLRSSPLTRPLSYWLLVRAVTTASAIPYSRSQRSGCLSDNTWASSATRGMVICSLATLGMSDSASLPRVPLFWTCCTATPLWICHQCDQCRPHHTQLTKALLIPSFSSCSAHQGRRVHQAPDKWAFVIRRRISRHLPLVARSPQHAASRLTGCAGTGPGDKGRASKD